VTNSIRTPRQGITANSRRIAQAVDNEAWQVVRLSMKGISTRAKIKVLGEYFDNQVHAWTSSGMCADCDVCIRIDNYIKALNRGGQLEAGTELRDLLSGTIYERIRK